VRTAGKGQSFETGPGLNGLREVLHHRAPIEWSTLRAGRVTQAAMNGVREIAIMRQVVRTLYVLAHATPPFSS
jgi:hypothetical protein